ncbi:thioredoxin family protein [Polaribacter cellanae]|uniref:Thioredoxin fold domain-containing protein n=1 Tax=Polaribacter cellanae TaxID=2818493 RepID=A0A975H6J9_9FLAO|nr:thioredoxin fold domain-containing protein [Polaribacter cellanae]QTE22078.1 thioredoxin fold domain-containing protein [Polaribacter cellanae]
MKKIIILLAITAFVFQTNAQKINWISLEKAVELQKTNPKKIMMDMYAVWCGPCKMLDKNTFQNKSVAAYVNKNYYAVKFNAEGNEEISFKDKIFTNPNYNPKKARGRNSGHELSAYFGVRAYPTIVFLDEKADFIAPIPGYKTPKQLELFLKLFESDAYKEIKNKEDFVKYQESFQFKFTE